MKVKGYMAFQDVVQQFVFLRKSNLIFALLMLNHFAKQIVAHSANQVHLQYCKALCSEM